MIDRAALVHELMFGAPGVAATSPDFERHAERILEIIAARIDLNDPATENAIADAIRRLAPEGAYVPLSQRYPWRFSAPTAGQQADMTLVDAVVEALRGSASVLEADRLTHLVPALIALAEVLERGALVPGPPPGRCDALSPAISHAGHPAFRASCELLATHAGLHEATTYGTDPDMIAPSGKMHWATVDEDLVGTIEVHKKPREMSDAELQDRLSQLHGELNRRHASTS